MIPPEQTQLQKQQSASRNLQVQLSKRAENVGNQIFRMTRHEKKKRKGILQIVRRVWIKIFV